jgi:hypothetical protein
LRSNCLLKHFTEEKIEGRIEVTERGGRRCKWLLDDLKEKERILEIDRRSIRSPCVTKSLWKRLATCRKKDYRKHEYVKVCKI